MKPYSGGIRHDYKEASSASPALRGRWSWFALGLLLPVVTVGLLLVSEPNESKVLASGELAYAEPRQTLPLAIPQLEPTASLGAAAPEPLGNPVAFEPEGEPIATVALLTEPAPLPESDTLMLEVQRGDSLDRLFRRHELSLGDLAAMVALPEAGTHLKLLKPGDEIRVEHIDGDIVLLSRELNTIDVLEIHRRESGFETEVLQREIDTRTVGAHGVITSSLFEAGMQAGISDAVTMEMAGIFQWDIDFIQDVRTGDEFTVVHEEIWRDGVRIGTGDIVAAEFVNRGRSFRAARFVDPEGRADYYTPEGLNVRKAFIRAPVQFTRISSNFNPNRRHPVLNTIRAHRGVDYAAPTGTPVYAAGDGKIISRGVNGGYGNAIVLQHGGNITTLYGHLSRFAGPKLGSRVRQGETIGYVGQSGLATGPHLHYEYRINGVHRNPRTVELPPADPIPEDLRQDFETTTAALFEQLDLYQRAQYAAAQD